MRHCGNTRRRKNPLFVFVGGGDDNPWIPQTGKILIVTYMNSAVNNFKQRISAELQKRGINGSKDYFVSTIHGLCLQIIKEKPDLIIANEEFEVIDEVFQDTPHFQCD